MIIQEQKDTIKYKNLKSARRQDIKQHCQKIRIHGFTERGINGVTETRRYGFTERGINGMTETRIYGFTERGIYGITEIRIDGGADVKASALCCLQWIVEDTFTRK